MIKTKRFMVFCFGFLMIIASLIPFSFATMPVNAIDNSTYGIVYFRTKGCGTNTNFTVDGTGKSGYINGCYGADGAFLGYNSNKTQVKFKIAGVTGWVNASDVKVYDYYNNFDNYYTSSYLVEGGVIKHIFSTDIYVYGDADKVSLGPAPSYLKNGNYYWSYDGHYFYPATKDGYKTMINDYRKGNYNNAINKNSPFYSYYQYLTHRTISNYTNTDLGSYLTSIGVKSKMTSYPAGTGQSLLYGEQTSFVQYQNEFGANLGLVLGVARNESATGTSNIAWNAKNLFGHSAFDSSPGASATSYISVAQSIYAHTKVYVSEGYLDPCDGRSTAGSYNSSTCHLGRYYGGHAGDKNSGMNVKYASDPYWGEKMAQFYYLFDSAKGMQDYNKYTIAVKQRSTNVGVYKDATSSSTLLYKSGNVADYPVVVLAEVTGQSINGNNKWYKIQTDPVLNSSRTSILQDSGYYNYENNYGYVHSSDFIKVNTGKATKTRYSITFDPNGGKFSDGVTVKKVLSVEQNVVPVVNAPTKSNDTFIGWSPTIMGASKNVTYVAQWKNSQVVKYNITFDANGGKFSDKTTTKIVSVNANTKPSIESPTREGYTFAGWDKTIVNATSNATYKAKWEKVPTYNITFDANGGKFKDSKSTKVVETSKGDTPVAEIPTKDGYVFSGWSPSLVTASKDTTYKATWKEGNVEDFLTKKDGYFYFDYLKVVSNKLQLKGYQTIVGINNNLNTDIKYEVIFENLATKEEIRQQAERITNKKEITKIPYSPDGKDYTYSWFKLDIDVSLLKNGNYRMYLVAYTSSNYVKTIINNKLYKEQATSYSNNDRGVIINNNYDTSTSFVELKVRDSKLANKNGSYIYNQYDKYVNFEFKGNLLYLKGYSYSYGMNLNKNASVTRQIIFENQSDFKLYKKNLGSIVKGNYTVVLPVSDKLDKTRAWYETNIDLSDIPKGTYVIYITTTSNITDIYEMTEKLGRSLSSVNKEINGKKYSFTINKKFGNRIEMKVE